MIIYKYVDAHTLDLILQSKRIMFTHPADFNDPFDRPRVSRADFSFEYYELFTNEWMTGEMQAEQADKAWGRCAVSSFTRTYDNALMWAHYADKHKGAVLEINAEVAGFTNKSFLIPAQFGSVIYMKRPHPDPGSVRDAAATSNPMLSSDDRFNIENYEGLQRLFLTKGLSWAYEEEVRVVCDAFYRRWDDNDESLEGLWKRMAKGDGNLGYGWRLQPGSITRVFAGLRYDALDLLCEQALSGGFQIMRPDTSRQNDYEVHFLPD
jgi:Protein of unknown function (DUF2971)